MKLFASLFSVLATILTWWKQRALVEQGRKEAALDAIKEVEARVEQAEAAVATTDPVRDERLRSRFDRKRLIALRWPKGVAWALQAPWAAAAAPETSGEG